ncbi:hypothetical protein [Thermopirellula anaerolimosa]
MKRRGIRAVISFAAVAVCYTAYARLIVPLIEPPLDLAARNLGQLEPLSDVILDARLAELAPLFPRRPDMLKNAKLLESDQVKLLLQDYRNLGDGRVLIRPCVLVMYPDRETAAGGTQASRQIIILEAPEGAVFQFDRPFQLGAGRIGRFVSGQLQGAVVLRSAGGQPGEDTAIRVTTRDITITERRIWTTQPVEFSWGRNRGRGSGMELVFAGGSSLSQVTDAGWHSLGLERFVLRHVDRLHLETAPSGDVAADAPDRNIGDARRIVEAACRGPLSFFPQQGTLTLQEAVEVGFSRGDGPSNRLQCDLLTVFLTKPPPRPSATNQGTASPPSSPPPSPAQAADWQIEGAVATGSPAVVTLGLWNAEIRCDTLRYDAIRQVIQAEAADGVQFTRSGSRLRAPVVSAQWTEAPEGPTLSRAVAEGGGEFRVELSGKSGDYVEGSWKKQLSVQREGDEFVSWMSGDVRVDSSWGNLAANDLWIWLGRLASPSPAASAALLPDLSPRRMLVRGDVTLRSPRLDADVFELQAWFVPPAPNSPGGELSKSNGPGSQSAANLRGSPTAPPGQSHYKTSGRILRAELALAPATAILNAVSMDGDVRIEEDVLPSPQLLPIRLRGEHVELTDVSGPFLTLSMTGGPAAMEGRGFALSGNQIFFERSRNLLSVAGPGGMRLPRTHAGNSGAIGFLDLAWEEGMSFDGRIVSVRGNVHGNSPPQRISARSLEARLRETVFLGDFDTAPKPQLASLSADGDVRLENERMDEQGRRTALDILDLPRVELDMISGAVESPGPGLLRTLRDPNAIPASMPPIPATGTVGADAQPSPPATPSGSPVPVAPSGEVTALFVRFHQALRGNLLQREVTCLGRVTVTYGSAPSWETTELPSDPAQLGPSGMILECRELTARQIPDPATGRPHLELEAVGNVTAEGTTYTARADRAALNESKTLLILEGGGQTAAELFRQEYAGGPVQKTAARRIFYWYGTRTVKIDGAQSLELSGFSEPDRFSR